MPGALAVAANSARPQIFLFGNTIFLYGECEDVEKMNAVLAADGLAAQWADDCDHSLMVSRSDSPTDKFAPLLHVYDMDVENGPDDATSGVPGTTRRDMGPPAELQAKARQADECNWSEKQVRSLLSFPAIHSRSRSSISVCLGSFN